MGTFCMEYEENTSLDYLCSFIIPVYNGAAFIDQCIKTIYSSCKNCDSAMEIIIIDDGSTDSSSKLLDIYLQAILHRNNNANNAEKIRILIIHTVNRGVSSARNTGLKVAGGKYVAFVDCDDTVDSKKMKDCINIVADNNSIDMVIYGMSFDFYRKGICYRSVRLIPPYTGLMDKQECSNSLNTLFDTNSLSSLCNRFIKRKVIQGIYLCEDMSVCEDLEFSLRAYANCNYLYFYNQPVYHYRQNEAENNSINRLKRVRNIRYIVDKIDAALRCATDDEGEHILSSLYALLAIDKIKGSKRSEIKSICEEYREWIDKKGFKAKNSMIYSCKVNRLIIRLFISRVRHRIAILVKTI